MRKSLAIAAITLSTLLMSACGQQAETPETPTTPETSASAGESGEATEPTTSESPAGETSEAPAGGGEITIWSDSQREKVIKDEGAKFTEATGVKVTVVQKNFEDLRSDFLAQVPTGKGPDITIGAHDWLGALVTAGVVDTVDLGDTKGDFQKVAIDAMTYDGQLYALPYAMESIALIQNTDLVGTEAPKTWDEMIEKGKASGAERPFVINTNAATGDGYTMYPFQTSFGAPVFKQDASGSYTKEVGMSGPEGQAFAKWLSENGKKGKGYLSTDIDYDINNELFASGKAAYTVQGPWAVPVYSKVKIAVNPVPSAGGQPAAPFVGVQGFYISAQSNNKLAAQDFLVNYLGTPEGQEALYKADPRLPALTAVAEKVSSDPIVAGFLKSSQNGVPMPSIPEMGAVWDHWNAAEAQIIQGADPTKTWTTMSTNLEKELKK